MTREAFTKPKSTLAIARYRVRAAGTGRAGRANVAVILVGAAVLLAAAAAAIFVSRRSESSSARPKLDTSRPSTSPATLASTAPASRPVVVKTYMDVVHRWKPDYPATQPLSSPESLEAADHFITRDMIYLCPFGDLWITRPEADPIEQTLARIGQEHEHISRDHVVFVHWTTDNTGRRRAAAVVRRPDGGFELASIAGRREIGRGDFDFARAFTFNDSIVVPGKRTIHVLHPGETPAPPPLDSRNEASSDQPASAPATGPSTQPVTGESFVFDESPASAAPAQVLLEEGGVIAWVPWDDGKPGGRGAARWSAADGAWRRLDKSSEWPEKLVQIIPLLDGSAVRIALDDAGKVAVSFARPPAQPVGADGQAGAAQAPAFDENRVAELVDQLSDPDPTRRDAAYAELARFGPAINPTLQKLAERQPQPVQIRLRGLLNQELAPRLGPMLVLPGVVRTVTRQENGAAVLMLDGGVSFARDDSDSPAIVNPAWIALRPGRAVKLLPDLLVHDLLPGAVTLRCFGDEWVASDAAHGPRRFLENHFERLVRKSEHSFGYFVGIDNRGRWIFRDAASPAGARTLILDPTLPDSRPRLPVWVYPVVDANGSGEAGWTNNNWPAVQRGGTWVLDVNKWRPLDEKHEKFSTEVPIAPLSPPSPLAASVPSTSTSASAADVDAPASTEPAATESTTEPAETEPPILTDTDGAKYYDGSTSLRVIWPDGHHANWPLPPIAVGNGDVWLFHTPDGKFFLFNQPGRVLRIARTPPGSAEPFKLEAVFTRDIPNTDTAQRIWLDPAGRIDIALSGELRILFPTGQVPPELAKMMPGSARDDDDDEQE